jgi:hypothetical protein
VARPAHARAVRRALLELVPAEPAAGFWPAIEAIGRSGSLLPAPARSYLEGDEE